MEDEEEFYWIDDKYITRSEVDSILKKVRTAETTNQPLSAEEYHGIIRLLLSKISVYGFAPYDETFGDERVCQCGHPYHRHFDWMENYRPVGCKYCDCDAFEEPA